MGRVQDRVVVVTGLFTTFFMIDFIRNLLHHH